MTKDELLGHCSGIKNAYHTRESYFAKHFPDVLQEILSYSDYPDGFSFQQKLYHYLHNDRELELGLCETCGKRTRFLTFGRGYEKYCSVGCSCTKERNERRKETCLLKYGDANYNNTGKRVGTCLEKYGVENPSQNNAVKEKKARAREDKKEEISAKLKDTWSKKDKAEHISKIKEGKLLKYGDANYNNSSKTSETYRLKTDEEKREIVEKAKQTKLSVYGNPTYVNREKARETNMERYGGHPARLEETKKKAKRTRLEKYGDENYVNIGKIQETLIERYGSLAAVQQKSVESRKRNRIKNIENFLGYTEDGLWIYKCTNKDCGLCKERQYEVSPVVYCDRVRDGYEPCTKLNPVCKNVSGGERSLAEYIKSIYSGDVVLNAKNVIPNRELDIWIPERKLAFEYNGVYWHSELKVGRDYHFNKTKACMELGIRLVHVWEDDWIGKNDIVKNLIGGLFGKHENRINARGCAVREIDTETAERFCNTYHIQGYTTAKVRLGLWTEDELAMVALFGPRRRISGGIPVEGEWELYRMCSVFNTRVRGGASKLLNRFVEMHNPGKITTFADLNVSDGGVYEKMGFEKECLVKPSYCWVVGGVRIPRYRFQKSNLIECKENPSLTEEEVMHGRGCFKCWDAGKIKYVYVQKQKL